VGGAGRALGVGMLSVGFEVCSSKTVSESSEVIVGAEEGGPEGGLSCEGAWSADCEAISAQAMLSAVDVSTEGSQLSQSISAATGCSGQQR
jgi:hypothetical protein